MVDVRAFMHYTCRMVLGGTAFLYTGPSFAHYILHQNQEVLVLESKKCKNTNDTTLADCNEIMDDETRLVRSILLVLSAGLVCSKDFANKDPMPPVVDKKLKRYNRSFTTTHVHFDHTDHTGGLYQFKTLALAFDVVYDDFLLDFAPTSNIDDYIVSMEKLQLLAPRIRKVFPGHDDSFDGTKLDEIATKCLASMGTCHTVNSTLMKQVVAMFLRGRNTNDPSSKCCYYSFCCCACQYF